VAETGSTFLTASQYLGFAPGSCWRWSDDAEAVEWAEGGTIAFRAEIEELLTELAVNGLPAFEAVVFMLDRCRKNRLPLAAAWARVFGAFPLFETHGSFDPLKSGLERIDDTLCDESTRHEDKLHLIGLLFGSLPDDCQLYTPAGAAAVIEALTLGMSAREFRLTDPALQARRWRLTVQALEGIVARFNADSLRLAKRTGLDNLVRPAPLELPPFERLRALLAELDEDPVFRSLTRLARDLMAAVHIPRPVLAWHDLPVGGLSDLANRGPLDRLLLSELANDDLTLAVRVALNEALYLRREVPPAQPRTRRAVLVDAGIRMWGVGRVFATATALALGATCHRREEFLAFRPSGADIAAIDLTTREGLIGHLAALQTEPHPGLALRRFLDAARHDEQSSDAILVTHRDCLSDPHFRRLLPSDDEPLYCATVDAEGRFQLLSRARGGWSVIREAVLNLEALLEPAPSEVVVQPLLGPDRVRDLPAIFHADPFPLLLPGEYKSQRACEHPVHGVVALTDDRRLLQWKEWVRGGRQVAIGQLHGHLDWIGIEDDGTVCLVLRHRGQSRLINVNLGDGGRSTVALGQSKDVPRYVTQSAGALFVLWARSASAYDLRTGALLESQPVARTQPGSRYVLKGNWLHAVTWDGARLRFEKLRTPALPSRDVPLAAFDRQGSDGPFVITLQGQLVSCTTGKPVRLRDPIGTVHWVQEISRDGDQLLLGRNCSAPGGQWQVERVLAHISANQVTRSTGQILDFGYSSALRFQKQAQPLHWNAVAIDSAGCLVLLNRRNRCLRIAGLDGARSAELSDSVPEGLKFESFNRLPRPRPVPGLTLRVAEFPGGSRVYSDPRGLLHLKSGDPAVPEVTLAIFDQRSLAGWSSDGEVCGPAFFLPDESRSAPDGVMANLTRFGRGAR
jgi:hypothetical protein